MAKSKGGLRLATALRTAKRGNPVSAQALDAWHSARRYAAPASLGR